MPTYTDQALSVLKEKGFRITRPRRCVVELLDEAKAPLSAYEIKDLLDARSEKVDTASIYRILDCLEENQLIHRVLTTGKVKKCALEHEEACTLHQEEHCHHMLLCQKCNKVEEVHCPGVQTLVAELEKRSGFRIQSHNMEFLGLCAACS